MDKKKNNIIWLLLGALVIVLAFTACPAAPKTVNQQLYPYLTVNTAGEIRVIAGVTMKNIYIPDDVYINGNETATKFMGFEDEAGRLAAESVTFADGITAIGSGAFKGTENLKNVSFEENSKLSSIGSEAFQGSGITSIALPETDGIKIGDKAFADSALTSVDLGGTSSIGSGAFSGTDGLRGVDLSGVSSIGSGAFQNSGLISVTIPSSVSSVGSNAFSGNNISSVTVESGSTAVDKTAFGGNTITNLTIPAGHTGNALTIYGNAITDLTINGGTAGDTEIAANSFSGAENLKNVTVNGCTVIGEGAFSGLKDLDNVKLGAGLETVGKNAFADAGSTNTKYTLPSSVTEASEAFDANDAVYQVFDIMVDGNKVYSVTLQVWPEGQESTVDLAEVIKQNVPQTGNMYIESIYGPTKGEDWKYHDDAVRDVTDTHIKVSLPGHKTNTENAETQYTQGGILNVDLIDKNVIFKDNGTGNTQSVGLVENSTASSVKIPSIYRGDQVNEIRENGFAKPVDVDIPETNYITTAGNNAFKGNTLLTPEAYENLGGLTTIGEGAFNGATGIAKTEDDGIKGITIPAGAVSIGKDAFTGTNAGRITIPASTADTGRNYAAGAFGPSSSLKDVVIEGPTGGLDGKDIAAAFGNNNNVTSLTIPGDLVDTEEEIKALHEAFPNLKEIVITPSDTVSGNPTGSLGIFGSLQDATIPADLLNNRGTDNGILDGSTSIKDLTVTKGHDESTASTTIPESAFNDLDSLTDVTIGEGVTVIGKTPRDNGTTAEKGAFAGCDNLKNVTLPSTVTDIGDGTFEDCKNLTNIDHSNADGTVNTSPDYTVPESVKDIGENAFKGTPLDTVKLPPAIESVGSGAFAVTKPIKEAEIPAQLANQSPNENYNSEPNTEGKYPTKGISSIFIAEPSEDNAQISIDKITISKGEAAESGTVPGSDNGDGNTTLGSLNGVVAVTEEMKKQYGDSLVYVDEDKKYVVNPQPGIITGNITIEEGIEQLGPGALANVGVATEDSTLNVTIPESVDTIGTGAFQNAPNAGYDQSTGTANTGNLIINGGKLPGGVTEIGDNAFKDSGLVSPGKDSLDISDFISDIGKDSTEGVTIGEDAFSGVNVGSNTDIVIPDDVTSIGNGAFAVTDKDGNNAASKMPGLSITIPGNAIGQGPCADSDQGLDDIFNGSYSEDDNNRPAFFEDVTITGDENTSFSTDSLTGKDDTTASDPDAGVDIVINGTLTIDEGVKDVTIGDLSNIGVPKDDSNLEIKLPTDIGDDGSIAINGPLAPTKVDENGKPVTGDKGGSVSFVDENGNNTGLPVGPSISIGEDAFGPAFPTEPAPGSNVVDPFWNVGNPSSDLSGNKIVNVSEIADGAFEGNTSITRVTIPADCTSIGPDAFKGCTNLTEIVFEGPRTKTIDIDPSAFEGCPINTVSVIDTANKKYDSTQGTAKFPSNSITEFESGIFDDAAFTTVILPPAEKDKNGTWKGGVTSVADGAFKEGISYEVTLPVTGFINEEYTAGTDPTMNTNEVTFKGTIGGTIASISGPNNSSQPSYEGHNATWQINGTDVVNGANISLEDLVGNQGGTVSWNANKYTLIDGKGSELVLEFGQEYTWDKLVSSLKTETGKEVTSITIGNTIVKKGESFTLTEELDDTELSFTQEAKSVSGSIMGTDGEPDTLTGIKYGESWSTVLSSVDKSNDVKFAFGTDDELINTSSNPNYIDLNGGTVTDKQVELAEEGTVISRYYPVTVNTDSGVTTEYHKLGSSISDYYSETNGYFVSNTELSSDGNVTDKTSVTEVTNGKFYVYEIVKITFDPDGNGKIAGSTSAYVMKYIKGSDVTEGPNVTANSGLSFKNWHTELTAANSDATYYAVYSLGTPSWATKEVLVGYRDDGSSRYTIGDFINKGTDNNTKYYLSNGDSASQLKEDSFDELYSTAVTADVASWKMSTYYYIDITGTAPDDTDIIAEGAYFKDSSNI